ncbi:di-copper centre-containing protein [Fusarium flagelliforme]|uniref:tyrosinase n=1 Tax=Fusarium flagelliforme TaxID=2675880 RepID=A0A395MU79_9HYPO|nr:di-copper centre-containing protein [Fusarium flagelliforme]
MSSHSDFYPITGIQDDLDPDANAQLRQVPVRMDVDDWFLSNELVHINQRALFFPAFWNLSQMSPHEKLSWFQLAGIHGKPFIAWDEPPQEGKTKQSGYCTHNSILFTTWHRPYMLLWEQVIYELMKVEAEKFTDKKERKELLEAAKSWRFPYWDWAAKKPDSNNTSAKRDYNVPLVIQTKKVSVRLPSGVGFGEVENAFYQFTMPGKKAMGNESLGNKDPLLDLRITPSLGHDDDLNKDYSIPFDRCIATSRWAQGTGINQEWIDGKQNNDFIVKSLRDYRWNPEDNTEDVRMGNLTASLRDAFYRVLTIEKFEDFATKRKPGGEPRTKGNTKEYAFDSAENIHDNLHGWCGGDRTDASTEGYALLGHMSHVPLAAFDPIFWLHHCNVDRLIAIWQTLHDDQWFVDDDVRNKEQGNFFLEFAHPGKATDKLRPFHDGDGKYFTSNDVREVTKLGYTYKGLERWLHKGPDGSYNKAAHLAELRESLLLDYGSSWKAAQAAFISDDPGQNTGIGLMSFKDYSADPVDLIGVDDYVVDIVYDKFALNGRGYRIDIFIGKVPPHAPYNFQEVDSLVGQVVNFSSEVPAADIRGCDNCRKQQAEKVQSTGRVILTNALITRFKNQLAHTPSRENGVAVLAGMDPDNVIPFLRDNLHWRVTSMGKDINIASQLPSLKVSLGVGKADFYADRTKMSRFYDYKDAHIVTEGHPGGATHEDNIHGQEYVYNREEL